MTPDELAAIAEPVARLLLGEPNHALSKKGRELRWGKHGSLSVDLEKGTYHNHETNEGGGVLKLIEEKTGIAGAARFDWLRQHGFETGEHKPDSGGRRGRIVATYDYVDEGGELLFQVCRLEPKTFRQRRRARADDDLSKVRDGWVWSVAGVRQVPYRLPDLLEAIAVGRHVVIVEGEKDVERLARNGIVATCNAGGADKWPDGFTDYFADADVVLIPDNDEAGESHMALVGGDLDAVAGSLRILRLPNLPPKGDVSDWFDGGGKVEDLHAMIECAPEWVRPAAGVVSRFGAIRFRDLDLPGPEYDYLIKGVLTRGERSLLVGPSGSGKSFVATDLAFCVATGEEFLGRRVRRGLVIYQAGEGARGLKKRVRAIRKAKHLAADSNVPFILLTAAVDLYSADADTIALIKEVQQWAALYKSEEGVDLELVVIDTFSAATPGANENASEDMSKILARCALISKHCNCHVMLVHHLNAAGSKPRGHSSLFANIENAIEVALTDRTCIGLRDDGSEISRKVRLAKVTKQKDGEDGLQWEFALKQITLGQDIDGDPITSCVIVGTKDDGEVTLGGAEEKARKESPTGFKLSKQEGLFFECLLDATAEHGVAPPAGTDLPTSVTRVVDYEHVKALMARRMLREEDNTEEGRKRHAGRVKTALKRAREALTSFKVIAVDAPFIGWTGKPVRGFAQKPATSSDDDRPPADDGDDLGNFV